MRPNFALLMSLFFLSSSLIGCLSKSDIDSDSVIDIDDNCPEIFNPDQLDFDKDKLGDLCDLDDDNDGFPDLIDSHPFNKDESTDLDNDGIGDNSDSDIDGDGIINSEDFYPLDPNEKWDSDQDGVPNGIDTDDDGDGWNDSVDQFDLTPTTSLFNKGPFNPGTMDLVFISPRGHEVTLQIWYPTKEKDGNRVIYDNVVRGIALEGATPDCAESRPVAIYSHGFPSIRWGSAFMLENLATHGFISLALDHKYGTVFDIDIEKLFDHILSRPVDIMESFDWLVSQNNIDSDFTNCIAPDDGYSIIGQSTGGFTSMMISGAKIISTDLENRCNESGLDENLKLLNCEILSHMSNLNLTELSISDSRVKSALLLSPWNASVLNMGISSVSVPTLVLTGDVDDTTVIAEVNNTVSKLGESVINYGIFNNSGHYAFAPIGCLAYGCEGLLDINVSANLSSTIAIIFLAKQLNWPDSNSYNFPNSIHIKWKYD
tara:strand:- start:940 stop:2400 length:1461 start_codon:yes stop_codon:yes gene_type:complete